jgi:hypothetical protein
MKQVLLAAGLGALLACSACATTVLEPETSGPRVAAAASVPETVPAMLGDRLDLLLERGRTLGTAIFDGNGRQAFALITPLWDASRAPIQAVEPIKVTEMDAQLALMTRAVERKRPADADKATRNLDTLFARLREQHPDLFAG